MSKNIASVKEIAYLEVPTLPIDIQKSVDAQGVIYLKSNIALEPCPATITERLRYWAKHTPNTVFLAQRGPQDEWIKLTYTQVWEKVQHLAQFLLESDASVEKPIAILSGNGLEHGLLALAAMHMGIPYAPISPAYSLRSDKYEKLIHCFSLLTPGLVFVDDKSVFQKALGATAPNIPVLTVTNGSTSDYSFENALKTPVTEAVQNRNKQVDSKTIAKILFTSGSTGLPKGVINTHGNMTTNWQQITQTFPFFKDGGLKLMDWLPWNHTFGGNHNFGLALYNGGTLYIDEGNPTPHGILKTIKNLKDFAPTVYFNVPKGFEELIPFLKKDDELRELFFSRLKMFFYAGASMSQHVWNGLENLALETIGKKILISSGLGMTEASPSAMFNTRYGSTSGVLGVPVPGLEVKLIPDGDKLEARFKGNNLTPGYWRNPKATSTAFDEEGFYKTGDALKFIDEEDPNAGMVFDGRIAEDFKLSSGTWVSVGVLRAKLIAHADGVVRDVVITGHDRDYLGAILIPDANRCKELIADAKANAMELPEMMQCAELKEFLQNLLDAMAKKATGSSTKVKRAMFADFELSIDKGEITDKGSINQRSFLKHRNDIVERIYNQTLHPGILETKH